MAKHRRSAVQKYHDRVASRYDASYEDPFWVWHDSLTWDYLKPHIPRNANAKVLDLGCGTGKWGAKLLKSGYHVTFVDISPKMIDKARQNTVVQHAARRTEFLRADLCDLSALPEAEYTLAVAMGDPIGCSKNPAQAMREIRRLLTPDGVLVATFDNRLAAIEFYLDKGDPKEVAQFLRTGKTHWLTKNETEQFDIFTYDPKELTELVYTTGFRLDSMVGKTVLPMRHYRELLNTAQMRRSWASVEKRLSGDPHAMGRASHLQIVCRVRA